MDSYSILVIILSTTLSVLLILCIIIAVILIKLLNKFKELTNKTEDIIDDVEAVSSYFRKTATSVAITGLIGNIVSKVADITNKKGSKK